MNTFFINAELLGANATDNDVDLMAALLQRRGHKVEAGKPNPNAQPPYSEREWGECLKEVARRK